MTAVFFTTCSRNKVGSGKAYEGFGYDNPPPASLLKARSSLYQSLLRSGEAQKLRGAVQGPDFMGGSLAGAYQEARVRYARGQFMSSLEGDLERNLIDLWLEENKLFFLSGLYGIVGALEPIQNYDVEMTEFAADFWREHRGTLTESLLNLLDEGSAVLECCGDWRYSGIIDWPELERRGFRVFHAIDPQREGGQIRAEAGSVAAGISEETLAKIASGAEFSGVNADIEFVDQTTFDRIVREGLDSPPRALPRVGVIDTGLDEFSRVDREATRRGWNRHFSFEAISTRGGLADSYAQGVGECVCLIPDRGHDYLVKHFDGKHPKDVFRGRMLTVKHPSELVLELGARP